MYSFLLILLTLYCSSSKGEQTNTCIVIFTKKKVPNFWGYAYQKNSPSNRMIDVDSRLILKSLKEVLDDPLRKITLTTTVKEVLKVIESKDIVSLGEISKSTIGILASKYSISDSKELGYLRYFIGNVYRYKIVSLGYKWVDMSAHKDDYLDHYKGKRILIRRIINRQDRIMAMITNEDFVNKKDLYSFKITDDRFVPEYILALINSKLFSFIYVNSSSISTKDDFRQTTLSELRRLPVALADLKTQMHITDIVREIINLYASMPDGNRRNFTDKEDLKLAKIKNLEQLIDSEIYKIYGINEDHISEIEERYPNL
jgi:hypothetical protein